jgi:hypothetical protein
MLAHLETIGATWLFQQMVEAHNQVKAYRLEEGTEMSSRVIGALEEARKNSDAAYNDVTAMIEALSLTADDTAPYEAFIRQWNGTLKIYQDIIDRKSGNSTSGNTANEGGTTTDPEQGGENGGETPETPDNPDTPDTPDTPDNPDNPGGEEPGGGDNGGDDNGGGTTPPGGNTEPDDN